MVKDHLSLTKTDISIIDYFLNRRLIEQVITKLMLEIKLNIRWIALTLPNASLLTDGLA